MLLSLCLIMCSAAVLGTTYSCSRGNNEQRTQRVTVAFYNTENLFDITDAPESGDNDFTPKSKNAWTAERYQKKLDNLYKVLTGMVGNGKVPALIGLSEVENRTVLADLVSQTPIPDNYGIIHYDSPDERGIDVALLYDPKFFTPTQSMPLAVHFDFDANDKTRDILYVNGQLGKQTLHIFVNHWPSRREGQAQSSPKREAAAQVLRNKVDSIQQADPNAKIIIMGDLNDHPSDKSVAQVLAARGQYDAPNSSQLYDLGAQFEAAGRGTHRYEGKWGVLDHLIVSGSLLQQTKGWHTSPDDTHIFSQDWMMYNDQRYGGKSPSATYGGTKYYGGISDHLPVYMVLSY